MKNEMLKIREEDRPYVAYVVDYLQSKGLSVEFAGSVLKGDGQYKDIDLIARGSLDAVTDAVSGLLGYSGRTKPFPQRTEDGLEFKVKYCGDSRIYYVRTLVDERFIIYGGKYTEIDVNFKIN